jgi:cell division septal protein FtsQ
MLFKQKKRLPTGSSRVRTPTSANPKEAMFSYHAYRSTRSEGDATRNIAVHDTEITARKRRVLRSTFLRLTVLVLLVALVAFSLQLSNNATIIPVGTSQQLFLLRNKAVYAQAADNAFDTLLNRNKLTVDTSTIENSLEKQFPELEAVSIRLPLLGKNPVVYVQPAVPNLILVNQAGNYLLNSSGLVLASVTSQQLSQLTTTQQIPVVTDQSGLSVKIGQVTLQQSAVAFITEVVGQLQAQGLKVSNMALPAGTAELYVRIQGAGYYIKFNLHGDAREEAGAYLALKTMLGSEHIVPTQYIDVRVVGRAYYL